MKTITRIHGYKHPPKKVEKDLTHGPLLKQMIVFSIPLILTTILVHVFKTADVAVLAIFVGDKAVAGVGSTTSLISLMTMLFMGISVGVNVMVSRYIGEGNEEHVKKAIGMSVLLSLIFGVILIFVGQFCSRFFLELMGCDPNVIDLAEKYVKIYFYGMPLHALYTFTSAVMRASGNTVKPLIYLIIGGVLNIFLNLFFVVVLKKDVEGVAIATAVSHGVSAVLCCISLLRANGIAKLQFKYIRIYKNELLAILRIGLPSGIQSSLFAISNVLLQSAVNSFGEFAMAGSSYAAEFDVYIYSCMNAVAVALMSFISQNYGANNYERVKKSIIYGFIINVVLGLAVGTIIVVLGGIIVGALTDNPLVINYFTSRNLILSFTYFLCGIMEIMSYTVRGLGKSVTSMIISLIGACVFRIIWIETIVKLTNNFNMIWWSYTASWTFTIIMFTPILISLIKKTKILLLNKTVDNK